ncbi:MAG: hypothetical protein KatS3mg027_2624 [Bacteroidia bacterium]|nr:MAG: hypothetical protein KatS3mg027_2624 [Bacteroidia bacterium]
MQIRQFILILSLLGSMAATAQTWCPPGAEWYYGFQQVFSDGYYRFYYDGDTTINSIICKKIKIEKTERNIFTWPTYYTNIIDEFYTYADTNKVYIYRYNNFYPMFDFSATLNDTILIVGDNFYFDNDTGLPCDSLGNAIIDSIGTTLINSNQLRYYYSSPIQGSSWSINGKIIEKIGPVDAYFFANKIDTCGIMLDWEPINASLRCYYDDSLGLYKVPSLNNLPCDYKLTIKEHVKQASFKIYPNPANNKLFIEQQVGYNPLKFIKIYNSTGQEIYQTLFSSDNISSIDVSKWTNGIYLLYVIDSNNILFSEKIIIQN